jgi:molybdate transport system substrate-binding protein
MIVRNLGMVVVAFILLATLACSSSKKDAAAGKPVLVFAAASTREAIEEIAAKFRKEFGVEVKVVAESSSRLATQIVNDAPADLFLSASTQWADHVKDKGFAQETLPLLTNNLVLVVPKGNPAIVKKPEDLTGKSVEHVALAGPAVPAGVYGRQSLGKLGLLDALEKGKKIVAGEDVRVTLTYVERGEAQAGIVYDTDARITGKVEVVYTFDASTHDPIRYPLVLLKAARDSEAARLLFDFMQTAAAARVFTRHGFTMLPGK